jgi:phosphoenolpyruvate carboxykinase (GTP)
MSPDDLTDALAVDLEQWRNEIPGIEEWFTKIGDKVPTSLRDELESLKLRLS